MKVLHFAPTLRIGSATQMAADLAYALQLHGTQSYLVAPENDKDIAPTGSQLRFIPFHPPALPGECLLLMKLRRIISSVEPSIIQAYGRDAITLAARALRRLPSSCKKPKLVGTLTGYPRGGDFLRSQELDSCDAITCVSKCLRQFLYTARPELDRVLHIPYGINDSLCYPTYSVPDGWQSEWETAYPELRGRFVICLPGPISAAHGTADIVPVLATLLQLEIPAHAVIAANKAVADASYMVMLNRRIRAAGIDGHVTWISNPTQLRDIMCSCHAVVSLTAEALAYDRPILEALSLGRPVTGYGHGASGEYLETFQPVGVVPVGDYDAIADVLSQWYTSPPDPVEGVPYPYRLTDTAKSYSDLYETLI